MKLDTNSLELARAFLEREGGWLLDLGDGHYLATDDPGIVTDLRGGEFIADCERKQVWDETEGR